MSCIEGQGLVKQAYVRRGWVKFGTVLKRVFPRTAAHCKATSRQAGYCAVRLCIEMFGTVLKKSFLMPGIVVWGWVVRGNAACSKAWFYKNKVEVKSGIVKQCSVW